MKRRYPLVLTIIGGLIDLLLCAFLCFGPIHFLSLGLGQVEESPLLANANQVMRLIGLGFIVLFTVLSFVALKVKGPFTGLTLLVGFGAEVISVLSFFHYPWYLALGLTVANLLLIITPTIESSRQRVASTK